MTTDGNEFFLNQHENSVAADELKYRVTEITVVLK